MQKQHLLSSRSVEDFATAEADAANSMEAEKLRARAQELARSIVIQHHLLANRTQDVLPSAREKLSAAWLQSSDAAFEHFASKRDQMEESQRTEREAAIGQRTQEAIAEATAAVHEEGDRRLARLRAGGAEVVTQGTAKARVSVDKRIKQLEKQIQELVNLQQDSQRGPIQQISLRHQSMRMAVTSDPKVVADPFAKQIITSVHSSEAPHAEQLRQKFDRKLHRKLVVAAFTPPADGLIQWIAAVFVGNVLGHLYSLRSRSSCSGIAAGMAVLEEPLGGRFCAATAKEEEALQRNLDALARAAGFIERGLLRDALVEVEAKLSGACRARASEWMEEARKVVLVQQATQVLRARAACLSC
jgi:hypothetical protein